MPKRHNALRMRALCIETLESRYLLAADLLSLSKVAPLFQREISRATIITHGFQAETISDSDAILPLARAIRNYVDVSNSPSSDAWLLAYDGRSKGALGGFDSDSSVLVENALIRDRPRVVHDDIEGESTFRLFQHYPSSPNATVFALSEA